MSCSVAARLQIEHHEHVLEREEGGPDATWCSLCESPIAPGETRLSCPSSECSFVCCSACGRRPLGSVDVPQLHEHALCRCTPLVASGTKWTCRSCLRTLPFSAAADSMRLRCARCSFDVCVECAELHGSAVTTSIHPHSLMLFNDSGPWRCASSILPGGCRSAQSRQQQQQQQTSMQDSSSLSTQPSAKRFRCLRCGFDFCEADVLASAIIRQQPQKQEQQQRPPDVQQARLCDSPTVYGGGGRKSNAAMVSYLEASGHVRSPQVKRALLLVDRRFFLPDGHPDPYSDTAGSDYDAVYHMQSPAFYADCLEELRAGSKGSSTSLVVAPSSGYMVALLSVLFPTGVSCGIDMAKPVITTAKSCVDKCRRHIAASAQQQQQSQPQQKVMSDVEFVEGNCFMLEANTTSFDRIHVDINCSKKAARQLGNYLRVGGLMTITVDGTMCLFEKETPFSVHQRTSRMDASGRRRREGTIIFPSLGLVRDNPSQFPAITFTSPKIKSQHTEFSDRLKEARRAMETLLTRGTDGVQRGGPDIGAARRNSLTPPKASGPPAVVAAAAAETQNGDVANAVSESPLPSPPTASAASSNSGKETLSDFLTSLGLEKYLPKFEMEEVTIQTLGLLTDDDLKSMGLVMGPRRLILSEIERRNALLRTPRAALASSSSSQLSLGHSGNGTATYINAVPDKEIGGGAFGVVYSGLWSGTTPVAMKTLHDQVSQEELMQEVRLLSNLRHLNILLYYGLALHHSTLFMVMELADGCVLQLLRDNGRQLSTQTLMGMALSCSAGMNYLSENRVIHRDLACRNLLYFKEGDNFLVKVADFGLAKVLTSDYYTVRADSHVRCFPIKWSSLETLAYRKHTSMSDVWSFGVVLWELFSLGVEPYTGMTTSDVYPFLQQGNRLTPPQSCPPVIAELMLRCWSAVPNLRPSFAEICDIISRELTPDRSSLRMSARGSVMLAPGVHYFQGQDFPSVGSISTNVQQQQQHPVMAVTPTPPAGAVPVSEDDKLAGYSALVVPK